MKLIRILTLLFLFGMLSAPSTGRAQTTYMPNDSTVCTSLSNVQKTALRIKRLEEEKRIAIERAAVAEVENDKAKDTVAKIDRKIQFWEKLWTPIKETAKAAFFITTGVGIETIRK